MRFPMFSEEREGLQRKNEKSNIYIFPFFTVSGFTQTISSICNNVCFYIS